MAARVRSVSETLCPSHKLLLFFGMGTGCLSSPARRLVMSLDWSPEDGLLDDLMQARAPHPPQTTQHRCFGPRCGARPAAEIASPGSTTSGGLDMVGVGEDGDGGGPEASGSTRDESFGGGGTSGTAMAMIAVVIGVAVTLICIGKASSLHRPVHSPPCGTRRVQHVRCSRSFQNRAQNRLANHNACMQGVDTGC